MIGPHLSVFLCPPLRLPLYVYERDDEDKDYVPFTGTRSKGVAKFARLRMDASAYFTRDAPERMDLEGMIDEASFLSVEQKNEIKERMDDFPTDEIHIRLLETNNHGVAKSREYFKDLLRAEEEKTTTVEHVSEYSYFTVIVMLDERPYKEQLNEKEQRLGFSKGTAWLVCYTDAESLEDVRYKGPKSGEENGKSLFSIHKLLNGPSGGFGFTDEAFKSLVEFEKEMRLIIKMWRENTLKISPVMLDVTGIHKFVRSEFEFESSKKNAMMPIFAKLEIEFQCRIVVIFSRGRLSKTHFNVKEISWYSV
jgi:hypothetical protein